MSHNELIVHLREDVESLTKILSALEELDEEYSKHRFLLLHINPEIVNEVLSYFRAKLKYTKELLENLENHEP